MIINFMAEKLIISFEEYTKIVEKLAILIHKNYKPTVLVGIMRGATVMLGLVSLSHVAVSFTETIKAFGFGIVSFQLF